MPPDNIYVLNQQDFKTIKIFKNLNELTVIIIWYPDICSQLCLFITFLPFFISDYLYQLNNDHYPAP